MFIASAQAFYEINVVQVALVIRCLGISDFEC
jgi:hypothetical protein